MRYGVIYIYYIGVVCGISTRSGAAIASSSPQHQHRSLRQAQALRSLVIALYQLFRW